VTSTLATRVGRRITRLVVGLVIAGTACTAAAGRGTGDGGSARILPPVTSVDRDGPFAVVIDEGVGPSREAWIFRPGDLDQLGRPHPVFLWGPGAGATPASYRDHLSRIASHGFGLLDRFDRKRQ
jgi:hypothetical protein